MEKSTFQLYLLDLGTQIKEKALEVKLEKDRAKLSGDHDYALGRLMAFYEIVTLMRDQASAFGITLKDVSREDINPDRDLL